MTGFLLEGDLDPGQKHFSAEAAGRHDEDAYTDFAAMSTGNQEGF
jgi:hypothetical protein